MNKKIFLLIGTLSILIACDGNSKDSNGDGAFISDSSNTTPFRPDDGRLLASNCFGCHGTNGISVTNWDSIAGEDELREEMFESDGIMLVHAKGYSNSEIVSMENFLKGLSKAEDGEYEEYDNDDDDDEKYERKRKDKEHDEDD